MLPAASSNPLDFMGDFLLQFVLCAGIMPDEDDHGLTQPCVSSLKK
jgi:hypothetical protein